MTSESRRLLLSGERVRALAVARGELRQLAIVGDGDAIDEVERAHRAIDSPHVPSVVERRKRDGEHELVCDSDAVLGFGNVLERQLSRGERVAYGIGIAVNEVAMDTVEAAHAAGEYLGALSWDNVWFGPSGRLWWLGFGHNFPTLGAAARARPGFVQAPEVSFGKNANAAADVFVLHAWIRTMLPVVQPPPLFADILASVGTDAATRALTALTGDLGAIDAAQRPQTVARLRERYRAIRAEFPGMPEPDFDGLARIVMPLAREAARAIGARLRVLEDGAQFQLDDGELVDLERRAILRRVMAMLVERHREGVAPATLEDVLAAGWPDELISAQSGRARVYVAISTLRKLGLDDVIERTDDGYRLAPSTRLLFD